MVATAPPSQSPRDDYDLGYGYLLRKDYALAEDTFRDFLKRYPSDRLAAEAHYWLGESMFQRQNYRDAADTFLACRRNSKRAPRRPIRCCGSASRSPRSTRRNLPARPSARSPANIRAASLTVKQVVEREQKRVRC